MAGVVGIDIGATKMVAILLERGRISAAKKIPTPKGGFEKIIDAASGLAGEIGAGRAEKIGVCVAGQVGDGMVYFMPNLGLHGKFGMQKCLEEKTGMHVRAGNDGQCFALAEWKMGAAKGCGSALGATIGTGIGGGIIAGGRLVAGYHSQAGEIGHMKLFTGGNKCVCGSHGCFEAYCAGAGIEKKYFAESGKRKSAKEIMQMKDAHSKKIANDAAEFLGIGLASLANVLDMEIIVLGGSLSEAYCRQPLFGIVKKSYARECLPRLRGMKITKAKLEHASAVGAALLFEG